MPEVIQMIISKKNSHSIHLKFFNTEIRANLENLIIKVKLAKKNIFKSISQDNAVNFENNLTNPSNIEI